MLGQRMANYDFLTDSVQKNTDGLKLKVSTSKICVLNH